MKKLGEITEHAVASVLSTDSPIEQTMYISMMSTNRFIMMKNNDEVPQGEGFFLYTQYPVGAYTADFIIKAKGWGNEPRIWPTKGEVIICVECDGAEFHKDKDRDRKRDQYFKNQDIKTLRFTGSQIHRSSSFCVKQIIQHLENDMWRTTCG